MQLYSTLSSIYMRLFLKNERLEIQWICQVIKLHEQFDVLIRHLQRITNEWKQKIVWTSTIWQQKDFDDPLKSRFLMLMNECIAAVPYIGIVILTLAPVLTHTQLIIIWLIAVFIANILPMASAFLRKSEFGYNSNYQ